MGTMSWIYTDHPPPKPPPPLRKRECDTQCHTVTPWDEAHTGEVTRNLQPVRGRNHRTGK